MKNDGGPAFPVNVSNTIHSDFSRIMSLRDYFAAKASEKDIDEIMFDHIIEEKDPCVLSVEYFITRQQARYIHADIMLKARES